MLNILLALVFYTCAILLGTVASRNTSFVLAPAISNAISAVLPIVVLIASWSKAEAKLNSIKGVVFSILTGIAVALFTIFLNKSYASSKIGIVAPIVFGGAIFFSAALSYIFFHETISKVQAIGFLFLFFGFSFIIYANLR
ncbi:hypothetical protein KC726_00210 [Candidatus Woesebacteria bacterium]|nr:hypothetical protein [Candidatus Woesebacteria bacterium]